MIVLDNELTLKEYKKIVYEYEEVSISPEALKRVEKNREIVKKVVDEDRVVYGLTTGFGNLANVKVSKENIDQLQINLIRSHATGYGEPASFEIVRGMLLLRLVSLLKGVSGINPENLQVFIEYLNKRIYVYVPVKGSLGASGDLAPLAHLTLALLGEGEVFDQNFKRIPSQEYCSKNNILKLKLSYKEGLALINGTSFMNANFLDAMIQIEKMIKLFDCAGGFSVESLKGTLTPFRPEIHNVRPHQGQIRTAKNFINLFGNSPIIESHKKCEKVQDAYSLRCIPQVHGAVKDVYQDTLEKVLIEMNSVTDNPLIFSEDKIYSQGNFHGEILALYADFMAMGVSELGNISERRLERLVNPSLSGLKPFLAQNAGLESGLMIVQYTAAALVSENKTLCMPSSVDSIPVSANQEDHVSMGANAVRKLLKVIDNTWYILASEILANFRARSFLRETEFSGVSEYIYKFLMENISIKDEDHPFYRDIEKMIVYLKSEEFINSIEEKFGVILL